jgi:ATP-binding cassette subfamily C (CFTR/MRP) protein 1
MQGGKIVQEGKFDELLQRNIGFEAIVGAHSQALESVMNAESSSRISSDNQKSADTEDDLDAETETHDQLRITKQESAHEVSHDTNEKGRLTQDEEREKGGIGKKVYWLYLRTVHGGVLVPIIIAAQLLFQIFQVASNYWMAWASPPSSATNPTIGLDLLFSVYITLSMGSALCIFARSMLTSLIGLLTSEKLFKNMIHCILRAPMSFFDSTPTGRILSRVSFMKIPYCITCPCSTKVRN